MDILAWGLLASEHNVMASKRCVPDALLLGQLNRVGLGSDGDAVLVQRLD